MTPTAEYDGEPIKGLPARLPEGEHILWQGSPEWKTFARRAFHTNKVLGYFAVLMVWRFAASLADGMGLPAAMAHSVQLAVPAALCLAVLALLAWAMARSAIYTITTKRLYLRFGMAFEKSFNLPFSQIEAASVRHFPGGLGDIPLTLTQPNKISYLLLWPHARPWFLNRPRPMLRSIANVQDVASILADALTAAAQERQDAHSTQTQTAGDTGRAAPAATAKPRAAGASPHGLGLSPQPAAAAE